MNLFEALTALATCVCAQIEADGGPAPCFCGIIPGDAAVPQYAGNCQDKCGMAWVRLMSSYPSSGVGVVNSRPGNCASEQDAVVEVGWVRCMPTGNQYGDAPTPDELLQATDEQMAGLQTLKSAIVCCPAFTSKDYILGAYTPLGPAGGLVGGTWTVTLAF